jgi:serine/threonine-protein kinase
LALTRGARLGGYEITAPIGEGGMGQVFQAHDTRLNRHVALKILPDAFASDPDRLARFTREAQTLASLNHPNIAHIHGLEESGDVRAIVMELVEGEDLSLRIARGAVPVDEALPIAKQLAEALEAAHEHGIIHRDLKPANVKVRSDGMVKVLDFGLAKAVHPVAAPSAAVVNAPTVTSPAVTGRGTILGTAAYMAPEQARGIDVDRRADLWALGVIVWEMLTGRRLFGGATVSDTLASVLTTEPNWDALPPHTPASIRRLLRRCLEKDRRRRLADAADARLEIDDAISGAQADLAVAAAAPPQRAWLAWASALSCVGVTVATVAWATRSAPSPRQTTRSILSVSATDRPAGANPLEQRTGSRWPTRTALALSSDGRTLVFPAIWGAEPQLYARKMNQLNATPIPGTSGGINPFLSPDGQWVGFWAAGKLRKVPLAGGPPVPICDAASIFGASWGSDDTIVFATARNGGLWRVSAAGGVAEALTNPEPGEYSHRLPHVLPGARAVVYTVSKGAQRWDDTQIVVRSLATGRQTVLVEGGADGRYVATGHLVYMRLGTLMAAAFDPVRLVLTGAGIGLVDGVMQSANRNLSDMDNTLAGQFTVAETGALVYLTGGALPGADRVLAWVNRQGISEALPAPPRAYSKPRLSPDGKYISVSTQSDVHDVWRYDIARGALNPITVDGQSGYSLFAPDGKRVVFRSGVGGGEDNLYWKAADGSGTAERLATSPRSQTPSSWSPDGTTLAYVEEGPSTGFFQFDILGLSITDREARPIVHTSANEMSPEFSPDGRWLAYVSSESGRNEVYVQPFPGPGERLLISNNSGVQPAWSADGRELFYVQQVPGKPLATLMSVSIRTAPQFLPGVPQPIFESPHLLIAWGRSYDVSADGRRFLIAQTTGPPANLAPAQMILVDNWLDELKRLVPEK